MNRQQLLFDPEDPGSPRREPRGATPELLSKAQGLALVEAGFYDPPPGVRFELDAWELVSSVTVDGPAE